MANESHRKIKWTVPVDESSLVHQGRPFYKKNKKLNALRQHFL